VIPKGAARPRAWAHQTLQQTTNNKQQTTSNEQRATSNNQQTMVEAMIGTRMRRCNVWVLTQGRQGDGTAKSLTSPMNGAKREHTMSTNH